MTDHLNLARLTDTELGQAFETACAFSATLYAQGSDDTAAERECDRITAELTARGIL